ncbi:hypothetical protein [Neomesorhizobium albiziae]|nr:hypothetical protein [Mesorhizobium albiziae]
MSPFCEPRLRAASPTTHRLFGRSAPAGKTGRSTARQALRLPAMQLREQH